jgi:hypothetical protein
MDNERDNIAAPDDAPATETAERLPWEQAIISIEPDEVADEAEDAREEAEVVGAEDGQLVQAEDRDYDLDEIRRFASSPQLVEILESHGVYRDPARYAMPDGFDPALVGGQPVLAKFFELAAKNLVSKEATDAFLNLASEADADDRQALYDAHVENKGQMEIICRGEWDDEAPARLEELREFLTGLPSRLGEAMIDARTSDGRRLIDHAEFPIVMSDLARGAGPRSNAAERLEKINNILKRDPARYFREKLDEEAISLRRQTISDRSADEVSGRRQVSGREAEILRVMKTDMNRFWREGMSDELANIRAAKAARGR